MTTFLIVQEEGTVETSKISDLLKLVDPTKDSVIADNGEIIHQPQDDGCEAEIVSV